MLNKVDVDNALEVIAELEREMFEAAVIHVLRCIAMNRNENKRNIAVKDSFIRAGKKPMIAISRTRKVTQLISRDMAVYILSELCD